MPPRSTEKLRKTTLNLFERDCEIMARWYGLGWSENVRALVRGHVLEKKRRMQNHEAIIRSNQIDCIDDSEDGCL